MLTLNIICRKFSSSNSRNFLRQSLQKSGKKILPFFSTSHCMSTTSCSVGDNPRDFMAASRSSTFQNDQSSLLWEYDQLLILLFPFWLKPWEISREYYYISSNNVSYNPHYPHGQNWPGLVPFLQWVKNYETPQHKLPVALTPELGIQFYPFFSPAMRWCSLFTVHSSVPPNDKFFNFVVRLALDIFDNNRVLLGNLIWFTKTGIKTTLSPITSRDWIISHIQQKPMIEFLLFLTKGGKEW